MVFEPESLYAPRIQRCRHLSTPVDTGLSFRFCAPIKSEKSKHEVVLNASSAFGFCNSFMEAVHIYVEASKIRSGEKGSPNNACGTYTTPNPTTSPD